MEYIPGGNLFKIISNKKINFAEKDINEIMLYLMKAILFLHHNGIIHRDIKPENILFSIKGEYSSLKLIDFGLSTNFNSKREKYSVGTPYYMSPEMLEGKYYFKSDMWSIGVILYILVTGKQPFRGKDKETVFKKISEGNYDINSLNECNCSNELKDFIKKCLVKNYKKRINVENALKHDWFKLFDNNKNDFRCVDESIIQSLKNFQYINLLQKETFYYLAKLSNDKELLKLKKAFDAIDKDNSGEIEYEEIPKIFKELNIKMSDKELKNIFNSLDFHCDGKINYSEFLAGTISSLKIFKEDKILSAFKYFDVNDVGYITYESVITALKSSKVAVDEKGLLGYFQKFNLKKINFEQFKNIVLENQEKELIKRYQSTTSYLPTE